MLGGNLGSLLYGDVSVMPYPRNCLRSKQMVGDVGSSTSSGFQSRHDGNMSFFPAD